MSAAPKLSVVNSDMPEGEVSPVPLSYPALPHIIEAEQAVLGACMVFDSVVARIAGAVKAADFYEPLHQRIFAAALRLDEERRQISPLTIRTAVGDDEALQEVGGVGYLANLVAAAPGERLVQQLAREIAEVAVRRRAMIAIWEAQEELSRPPLRTITEILSPVVSIADDAARDRNDSDPDAGTCAVEFLREIEDGRSAKPTSLTGFEKLDDHLGGLFPTDVVVVGGRPGMGKSLLATCIARNVARSGRVDIFSLEMSRRQNTVRMLCDIDFDSHSDKPLHYSRLMRHKTSQFERDRAAQAMIELQKLPIAIHDRGGMTMAEITGLARARASRHGAPSLIAIDHLQIVNGTDQRQTMLEIVTKATKAAKCLAKSIGCPVLLLSQLNRDVEKRLEKDRMPILADLRESGSIEQDADVIIMLYRPAFYIWQRKPRDGNDPVWDTQYEAAKNKLEVSVPKNRGGPMFDCSLFIDPGAAAIRDEQPLPPGPDMSGMLV